MSCCTLSCLVLLLLLASSSVWAEFDPKDPRVEDRLAIEDLLTRYGYAVDTKNWGEYRRIFVDDALIDYSDNLFGEKGDLERVTRFLKDSTLMFSLTIHRWSNAEIFFQGPNEARVRARIDNPMYIYGFPVFQLFSVQGYYHHQLVKGADGVWRSKQLTEEITCSWHNQVIGLMIVLLVLWKTRSIKV